MSELFLYILSYLNIEGKFEFNPFYFNKEPFNFIQKYYFGYVIKVSVPVFYTS